MLPKEEYISRLAYIKYLFQIGEDHSRKPEPICFTSLLLFHDAVELFLHLAAIHHDAKIKSNVNFLEYWDILKPSNIEMTQKAAMTSLNKARVGFKHSGIIPSKDQNITFKVYTEAFLKENTPIVFGFDFEDVSLIDLVKFEECRNYLRKAQECLKNSEYKEVITNSTKAYWYLIEEFENNKKNWPRDSPYTFGRQRSWPSASSIYPSPSSFLSSNSNNSGRYYKGLAEFINNVSATIAPMQKTLRVLALGIDYSQYARFDYLTPIIYAAANPKDEETKFAIHYRREEPFKREEAEFCINFVIQAAVKLQENDYELSVYN